MNNSTITALENFATSTALDRATLSKLKDTVQELTAELKAARVKIDELQQQLDQTKHGTKHGGKDNANPNTTLYFCWTHGFSCDQPSRKCPKKADVHQDEVSGQNTMGGSSKNLDDFLCYMNRNIKK